MARASGTTADDIASGRRSKAACVEVEGEGRGGLPTYLPASFKNVPFFVLTSQDDFGRRGDLYEYPLNDSTGYVDLGRKARRFKIEGYLIGGNQVALTRAMRDAAESPQPGILIHPMYGPQDVACVTLSASADYRKDQKRTRLAFDFIEAVTLVGETEKPKVTPKAVFDLGSNARRKFEPRGVWSPNLGGLIVTSRVRRSLADKIKPGRDEASWDAIDALEVEPPSTPPQTIDVFTSSGTAYRLAESVDTTLRYLSFDDIANPIDVGTATVRRLWGADALARLRLFNGTVVKAETEAGESLSVESLVITSRLSLIRDFAVAAIQKKYPTKNEAFADLDFIMAVYDDEEAVAAAKCWDDLVVAIRAARATAASAMLAANITAPGIFISNVEGVWPSLVVAQKLYADGSRFEQIEAYNAHSPPFFIGREAVALAR